MERKQFFIVLAVIINKNREILLARRNEPELKYAHNKWELVGGGINFGETPEQALIRETKEEAGVDIKILRLLPKVMTHTFKTKFFEHQIIMLSYECKIIGGRLKPGLDQEIGELKFVPLEKIKNYDTLPNVYQMAKFIQSTNKIYAGH